MNQDEYDAASAEGPMPVPRTFGEKTGCLMLLLWALWAAVASIWKTAEVIGHLIGL